MLGLDKEIVKIFGDTVTYIIYNPKGFLKLKSNLKYASRMKPSSGDDGKTTFHLMKTSIILKENEIYKSEGNFQREYVFKCFLRN
jgi:hypothetical protein